MATAATTAEPLAQRRPTLVIKPRRSWLPANPKELWEFRELMVRFAARDITLRYRQTALGVIWVIAVPLLGAGILSFVFGNVANLQAPGGVPYVVFTLAGMVVWTGFSQIATRSSSVMVGNAQMVQKVFFPRLLLPFSTVLSTMVDVAVGFALLTVLLEIKGMDHGPELVVLPIWLGGVVAMSLGIGLVAGALMVRYRDIQYILPVGIQFLLFASPVAYTLESVPDKARWAFDLNPLTGLLEGMRWSMIDTQRPPTFLIVYSLTFSVVMLVVGLLVFSRMESKFADVI